MANDTTLNLFSVWTIEDTSEADVGMAIRASFISVSPAW